MTWCRQCQTEGFHHRGLCDDDGDPPPQKKEIPMWTITVTRIGTKPPEIVEKIEFQAATDLEAEHKLGDVWNRGTNGAYCNQPGRFRAKLRRPDGSIYQTID